MGRFAGGADLQRRVAAAPLVGGLLALHDLHPVELSTRLRYALEEGAAACWVRTASGSS